MKRYWHEFRDFLSEYKVLSVAVAFVMGQAVNDMVKAFVNNIFMPFLDPLIPNGTWESATWSFGGITLGWGVFLSTVIRFAILSIVIFVIVKKLIRAKKEQK